MIKLLNRVTTAVAVGDAGVVLSWLESGSGEVFSTDSIPTPWSSSSEDFDSELKALVDKVGMRDSSVSLSIPDDKCYMAIHSFEELPKAIGERDKLIKWTVAKNLHMPEASLVIDYHLLGGEGKAVKVLSVAVEVGVVSLYEDVLKKAGLNVWTVGIRSLSSLTLASKVTKGSSNYIYFYYGSDYFTIIIFKNDRVDFIRTKSLSGISSINQEVSATVKSYLGKNAGFELEKFFILTSSKEDLKDLDVGEVEFLDDTLLGKSSNYKGSAPIELVLASIGSVKS